MERENTKQKGKRETNLPPLVLLLSLEEGEAPCLSEERGREKEKNLPVSSLLPLSYSTPLSFPFSGKEREYKTERKESERERGMEREREASVLSLSSSL